MTEDNPFKQEPWQPYKVQQINQRTFWEVREQNVIVNSTMDEVMLTINTLHSDDTVKYIEALRKSIVLLDYNYRQMQEQLMYWRNEAQKPKALDKS